jgi:hypothetical protein
MSAHPNVCQCLIRVRKTPISRRAEHHKTLNLGIRQSPAPGSESKIERDAGSPRKSVGRAK